MSLGVGITGCHSSHHDHVLSQVVYLHHFRCIPLGSIVQISVTRWNSSLMVLCHLLVLLRGFYCSTGGIPSHGSAIRVVVGWGGGYQVEISAHLFLGDLNAVLKTCVHI